MKYILVSLKGAALSKEEWPAHSGAGRHLCWWCCPFFMIYHIPEASVMSTSAILKMLIAKWKDADLVINAPQQSQAQPSTGQGNSLISLFCCDVSRGRGVNIYIRRCARADRMRDHTGHHLQSFNYPLPIHSILQLPSFPSPACTPSFHSSSSSQLPQHSLPDLLATTMSSPNSPLSSPKT